MRNHTIIIGEFIYSISALFGQINLEVVQQTFKLAQCKSEGKINISMALKVYPFFQLFSFFLLNKLLQVLVNENPESWVIEDDSATGKWL